MYFMQYHTSIQRPYGGTMFSTDHCCVQLQANKVLMNESSIFLSMFSSPPFSPCYQQADQTVVSAAFPIPQPSHKPKGNSIMTFGHGAEPSCTCGCLTRSAFSSSCMLPQGQRDMREDLRDGLGHDYRRNYSMCRHLVCSHQIVHLVGVLPSGCACLSIQQI